MSNLNDRFRVFLQSEQFEIRALPFEVLTSVTLVKGVALVMVLVRAQLLDEPPSKTFPGLGWSADRSPRVRVQVLISEVPPTVECANGGVGFLEVAMLYGLSEPAKKFSCFRVHLEGLSRRRMVQGVSSHWREWGGSTSRQRAAHAREPHAARS